jgi:hypothetical protein
MTSVELPNYYDVMKVPMSDDASIGYYIHTYEPANSNQAGLNNKQEIKLKYVGDTKVIRLDPLRCGFRVRYAFRTHGKAKKDYGAKHTGDQNAHITFSPNWFWHLFDNYKLKLGNKEAVESIDEPGVYADVMSLFKGSEFKNTYGELCGYIPDEGSGKADLRPLIGTGKVKVSEADVQANTKAGQDVTVNVSLVNNPDFNNGFKRRMEKYNYDVTKKEDVREGEDFIPLSMVSNFFATDTCLMDTGFEITLKRKGESDYGNAFFGAADTNVDFGDSKEVTDTGLMSIKLELFEQKPNLVIEGQLSSIFKNTNVNKKPVFFLKGSCEKFQMKSDKSYNYSSTSHLIPRYVINCFKGAKDERADANNDGAQELNPTKNFSLFAHADIKSCIVSINGQLFPNNGSQDAEFLKNKFSPFYQNYMGTCKSFGVDPSRTSKEFKENDTVFAYDCSEQEKKVSTKTTNLQVKIERNAVPATNASRANPRVLDGYIIVLEDYYLQIDSVKGVVEEASIVA